FYLRGIVYFGDFHFTSRFIDSEGNIWYNDGITTGRQCMKEGNISTTSITTLLTAQRRTATLAIYAQI
ncbi:hypothetical protein OE88DRAFT_1600301, partial [Heliocybe sulcata]